MKGVTLQRVDQDGSNQRQPLCLAIDIAYLLDWMPVEAQKEFVGHAVANGELLKLLCQEVAGVACESGPLPVADLWLDHRTRGEFRAALAPILGPAVADELARAKTKADQFTEARDLLRELALVTMLSRDARELDERCDRNRQLSEVWRRVFKMFPEYAPKQQDFSKTPAITTSPSVA